MCGFLNLANGGCKPQQAVRKLLLGDGERREQAHAVLGGEDDETVVCLLYTSPSPRDS